MMGAPWLTENETGIRTGLFPATWDPRTTVALWDTVSVSTMVTR